MEEVEQIYMKKHEVRKNKGGEKENNCFLSCLKRLNKKLKGKNIDMSAIICCEAQILERIDPTTIYNYSLYIIL